MSVAFERRQVEFREAFADLFEESYEESGDGPRDLLFARLL